MARIIGRLGSIGIGVETTRGTAVAPAFWVPVTGKDFDDKVDYIDNDSGMGNIMEKNDAIPNHRWGEGGYDGKIFDRSVGAELVALFGQAPVSTQRGVTGVYDHVFNLANSNQHKSLSLSYKDANESLRWAMAMLNSWSLEGATDNYVRRTAGYISKKAATEVVQTASYTEENEFGPQDISFILGTVDSLTSLDAASSIGATGGSLEISKNAEAQYKLGSNEPDDIVNKQFAVTGTVDLFMDNTTYKALVLAGGKVSMRVKLNNAAVDLGSGHNPGLTIDLARVKLGEFEGGFDNNDVRTQTINFEGLFSLTEAKGITAKLTNRQVSY